MLVKLLSEPLDVELLLFCFQQSPSYSTCLGFNFSMIQFSLIWGTPMTWEELHRSSCTFPSGNLTQPWKITTFSRYIHYQLPFAIAMLVYWRVRVCFYFLMIANCIFCRSQGTFGRPSLILDKSHVLQVRSHKYMSLNRCTNRSLAPGQDLN